MCCSMALTPNLLCRAAPRESQPESGIYGPSVLPWDAGEHPGLAPCHIPPGTCAPEGQACPLLAARFGCAQQPPSLPTHPGLLDAVPASLSRCEALGDQGACPHQGIATALGLCTGAGPASPFSHLSDPTPGTQPPDPGSSGCFPWAARGSGRAGQCWECCCAG